MTLSRQSEMMASKEVDLDDYDIGIIGLGIAGSNLARLLLPHLKVIAIDKKIRRGIALMQDSISLAVDCYPKVRKNALPTKA